MGRLRHLDRLAVKYDSWSRIDAERTDVRTAACVGQIIDSEDKLSGLGFRVGREIVIFAVRILATTSDVELAENISLTILDKTHSEVCGSVICVDAKISLDHFNATEISRGRKDDLSTYDSRAGKSLGIAIRSI